jgi:hypothetical protein
VIGEAVIISRIGRLRISAYSLMWRRRSPSVKMPFTLFSSSTIPAEPARACVMATTASLTVALSRTTASRAPVRMMSETRKRSERPMAPPGWSWA